MENKRMFSRLRLLQFERALTRCTLQLKRTFSKVRCLFVISVICSIALLQKIVLVSVLYFLVVYLVSFVAAILSFFVCKPRVNMLSSKSTKRGFGECPQCGYSYLNRRKPPNCEKCGYHLGGKNESVPKKPKRKAVQAPFLVGWSHFVL